MKRRDFLRNTLPATTLPFLMNGFPLHAFGRSPVLEKLMGYATETDHVLVLVQLNGGNDGLNTVIPLDQYSNLMAARSNVAIPENKVLKLTDKTGLHPSMSGIKSLYEDAKIGIVQSVGYPDPNFSHFRSTDIWLTASDADVVVTEGWAGRYLDMEYPGFPTGYPNTQMPDPLAITIGALVSNTFQGPAVNMGMAITSSTSFYQLLSGGVDTAPNTPAGHELTFIRQVVQQTQVYVEAIKTAAAKASNQSNMYPAANTNSLADQLKIVAQLIAGGLKTRLYVVSLGGFDTHSNQVPTLGGTETGAHATLLDKVSVAISAFQDDLRLLNVQDRVVGMTFSEFGRRIKSNSSNGTDHGAAAPLIVFGTQVNPIIHGTNPVIPATVGVNDNLPMQFDFRSIYGSILKDWFGVSDTDIETILFRNFQHVPVIKPQVNGLPAETELSLFEIYPNPFVTDARIRFRTSGANVQVRLFDAAGREVQQLADGHYAAGEHEISFEAGNLANGLYYCRLQAGNQQQIKQVILNR